MASENPEFGTTVARRLNQSRVSAVLQSNLIAIKFGTAEARRLNWASGTELRGRVYEPTYFSFVCVDYVQETVAACR